MVKLDTGLGQSFRLSQRAGHAVQDISLLAVTLGQPLGQEGGCGEHDVGGVGQTALPVGRDIVPLAVAVVDQPVIGQIVQHVDMLWGGHPQQGRVEPVADGLLPDEDALAAVFGPEEMGQLLTHAEKQRGEGIDRHVGADFAAVFLPAFVASAGRGAEI